MKVSRRSRQPIETPAPGTRAAAGSALAFRAALAKLGRAAERIFGSPWSLPTILAIALLVRLANVLILRGTPFFTVLQLDHRTYDEWGRQIAAGDLLGHGAFFVDPLYAYVLGAIYAVFGHDLMAVRVFQVLLGTGTCYLTALLGRRALGSRALGNFAALLMALYIPAVHADFAVEKTELSIFLFTLALVLYLGRSRRAALFAGVALGLATLARGNALLLVPLGAAALLLERDGAARAWRRATLFLAGAAAIISLATIRNYAVSGEIVPTTSGMGQNFYIGQYRGNRYGTYSAPDFVRPDPRYEESDFRREAERRSGHAMSAAQVSAYWLEQGLTEIWQDPGAALRRSGRKLRMFWHRIEVPDNLHVDIVAGYSPVLRSPLLWMGWIFPPALLGAVAWWRRRREVRVIAAVAGVYCASVVLFFVLSRFRVQVVPIVAVLAAAGVWWLWDRAHSAAWLSLLAGTALLAAAAAWSNVAPQWLAVHQREGVAIGYHNLGSMLSQQGDVSGAQQAYERAVATDADAVPASMAALGEIYLQEGQYERAEQSLLQMIEKSRHGGAARPTLVRVYEAMRRDPRYGDSAALRDKLAAAYRAVGRNADADRLRENAGEAATGGDAAGAQDLYRKSRELRHQGNWSEAIAALQEAIRIGPYDEGQRYTLGGLMEAHATPAEMVLYYAGDVKSDPKPQTSHYFWAVGLEREGNLDAAIEQLQAALQIDPAHEMSQNRWGTILEKQGHLEEALQHYREATAIFPDFRGAHENAARVLRRLGRNADAEAEEAQARKSDPNTPKRYVYWARYLLAHDRRDAAVAELERALRRNPQDEEARRLLAPLRPQGEAMPATPELGALAARLRREGPGHPLWLAVYRQDPAAVRFAAQVRSAFTDAGWEVRADEPVSFAIKPGVFLFAADDPPPAYVGAVRAGLEAAGLSPVVGTGYRKYYDEMIRTKPGFHGFRLDAEQSYVLVIGPVKGR